MAITNYATLQTAVASWLQGRTDLTANIKEFIQLGEVRISGDLAREGHYNLGQEARDTSIATVSGTAYYTLPTGSLQVRNVKLNTSPVTSLTYLTPDYFDTRWASSTNGKPKVYTIIGNQLRLGPTPDGIYTVEIDHYVAITALSDANTTNWIVTNAPNLILYAALLETAPFLNDDDKRISKWAELYEAGLETVLLKDRRARQPSQGLSIQSEYRGS